METSDDSEKSKPHPDIFQATLDRLKLHASEVIALGDTPWDIEGAKKAGVNTVAVTSGGWTENQLYSVGELPSIGMWVSSLMSSNARTSAAKRRRSF